MQWLASVFVGRPLNIALVGAVFLAAYAVVGVRATGAGRPSRMLLVAAAAWLAYAAWEWLVEVRTPEANIRVDLLVIWPALATLSLWAVFRALR
jgi:hypothetical protein